MSVSAAPSIFDVYNARQWSPEQVAGTFVPPPYFGDLIAPTHTVIVGPRGSGKTTLLKMLHPAALDAWKHKSADHVRSRIGFTGVFIATDINWNEQVKSLGEGRLDPHTHTTFTKAAFTTEILDSLLESMMYCAGRMGVQTPNRSRVLELSPKQEAKIAQELMSAWHIDRALESLEGLRIALSRRLSQIRVLASQEASRGESGRGERIANLEFLHLDFLTAAGLAVDLYNIAVGDRSRRWALLFDELELAPQWIRALLIRFLRSVDERFLFKISLSPYAVEIKRELEVEHSPGGKQDFTPIRLWFVHKEEGYPFCQELLAHMLNGAGKIRKPNEIFGTSDFFTEPDEWRGTKTAYRSESKVGKMFQSLAERDPTFNKYLESRRIDPHNLNQVEADKRAADLRKVRSIVALRAYFRAEEDTQIGPTSPGRRSRKVPAVYGGATSLFAMVEGNPRWFIGIVGELLKGGSSSKIGKAVQVRQVLSAASIFRAMLATIPCSPVGDRNQGLLSLLDPVGRYFSHCAIDGPFDGDPPCSFTVDQTMSNDELRALGKALNAGAIVLDPEEGDVGIVEDVRGKRFRLSYILAPYYRIPLVLGRSMPLGKVLQKAAVMEKTSSHSSTFDDRQPSLFGSLEVTDE